MGWDKWQRVELAEARFEREGGDVGASYCADKLCEKGHATRGLFHHDGDVWASVSVYPGSEFTAYRVREVHRVSDVIPCPHPGPCDRDDERGGYHGMLCKVKGQSRVLVGPPCVFVPGKQLLGQMSLFEEAA